MGKRNRYKKGLGFLGAMLLIAITAVVTYVATVYGATIYTTIANLL